MPLGISETISRLSQDHIAFRRLLNVLDRQVGAIAQSRSPDYDVLSGLLAYLKTYPGKYHHQIEDLVYDTLCLRRPAEAALVAQVAAEHRQIANQLNAFSAAVGAVIADGEVSREAFCTTAREYIAFEREHIRAEEGTLFALATQWLTSEDWFDIDNAMRKICAPLAGPDGAQFEKLRADIFSWDFEDQASITPALRSGPAY